MPHNEGAGPPSRRAVSADGTGLAVFGTASTDLPVLVAVHGYPDDHTVWDRLTSALAGRFDVITYDVRGVGASDAPGGRAAYRVGALVDDLVAVVNAISPAEPVHLLGHDWGSVQSWPALSDPRLAGRISSYTSISGPGLHHFAAWLRDWRRHRRAALRQLLHSYYVLVFALPAIPELAIRSGLLDSVVGGRRRPQRNWLGGLALYRANLRPRRDGAARIPATLPVQVIAVTDDPFVTPTLAIQAPQPWVENLIVRRIDGGHWAVHTRADRVAELLIEFVGSL